MIEMIVEIMGARIIGIWYFYGSVYVLFMGKFVMIGNVFLVIIYWGSIQDSGAYSVYSVFILTGMLNVYGYIKINSVTKLFTKKPKIVGLEMLMAMEVNVHNQKDTIVPNHGDNCPRSIQGDKCLQSIGGDNCSQNIRGDNCLPPIGEDGCP